MKLPIGLVARFAFRRIVLPAIGKAVADPNVKLTKEEAKAALVKAVQDEAVRQMVKRAGSSLP